MLKAVIDTNVFVSAFLTDGIGAKIIKRWKKDEFILITSKEILQEVSEVLKRLGAPDTYIARLMKLIQQKAKIVKPNFKVQICRDPDDNKFIDCAIKGNASIIVTSDQDLKDIGEYKNIIIISAKELLEQLEKLD